MCVQAAFRPNSAAPGDFDHAANVAQSNRYFVDNFSRVNTVPTAALFDATGRKVMNLEEADFTLLTAAGIGSLSPTR